ncbi:MAG: helix-turn-helix domain-containing protein [Macromonas sp.]
MKTLKDLKATMLQNPEFKAEYDALASEFDMARELVAARNKAGLTQSDVAQRMGTTQSAVARMEGGSRLPSIRTVQRYAKAVGCRAVVKLEHA